MPEAVAIKRLDHGADLPLPAYQSDLAAGMDLMAATDGPLTIATGERVLVPTGIAIALSAGLEGQIRPRSGLAAKQGLTVLNAPGTIDADYRGEIGVILVNLGNEPATINRGDRIAQLVIAPVQHIEWAEVDALPRSARGDDGFGSTGVEIAGETPC